MTDTSGSFPLPIRDLDAPLWAPDSNPGDLDGLRWCIWEKAGEQRRIEVVVSGRAEAVLPPGWLEYLPAAIVHASQLAPSSFTLHVDRSDFEAVGLTIPE